MFALRFNLDREKCTAKNKQIKLNSKQVNIIEDGVNGDTYLVLFGGFFFFCSFYLIHHWQKLLLDVLLKTNRELTKLTTRLLPFRQCKQKLIRRLMTNIGKEIPTQSDTAWKFINYTCIRVQLCNTQLAALTGGCYLTFLYKSKYNLLFKI